MDPAPLVAAARACRDARSPADWTAAYTALLDALEAEERPICPASYGRHLECELPAGHGGEHRCRCTEWHDPRPLAFTPGDGLRALAAREACAPLDGRR